MDDEGADREFWVALFNLPQVDSLRSLRSAQLGRLVAFQVRLAVFSRQVCTSVLTLCDHQSC